MKKNGKGERRMNDFEKLYKEYYPRVYSFLYKICRNHDLCEEMTQETFFQAYLSFHKFRGNSSIFTYLAAIAKNVYFKYLRKSKVETVDIDLLVTSDDDSAAQPYEMLEKKLAAEKVNRFIKELPKNYKDVVFLRIYADLPFSEIAANLGISENSAKVIFYRAKKILKEAIKNDTM